MFRNYLLIILRNFKRQKLFTALNMFGLALGLASAILIFLYVSDELRYDVMHPHFKNAYRVGTTWSNADGRIFYNTVAPGFFTQYLKDNRSEVLKAIRIDYIGYPTSLHHKANDKIILTEEIKWAEPHFDDVIDFHLVRGDQSTMFNNTHTMVISETGARRLFGNQDPMGQVVTLKHTWATQNKELDVTVTGVYKDFPSNSHFKPHYIINVNAFRTIQNEHFNEYMQGTRFGQYVEFFETYIILRPGADIKPINAALDKLAEQMIQSDSQAVANGWKFKAFTTKMADLHFDKQNLWEGNNVTGDKTYLGIFSAIAFLIMLIACINYMNLATARSVKRAKEVGLRKSFGSNRAGIAQQFFMESFLMTLGSLIMAILLVILFLQPFNQLASKSFTLASLVNPVMIMIVLGIVIFMGFLAGIYPAFYLSAFQAVEVLKGHVAKGKGAEFFRKSLVAAQYTVALVLIICTFIVIRQMDQLKTTKLNEQRSQLLSIRFGGIADQSKYETFKRMVLKDPEITNVTMANHLPRLNYFGWIGVQVKFPQLDPKELQWNQLNVDYDFPSTYKLEFLAGRNFEQGNPNDSNSLLMNEAAVKALNKRIDQVIGSTATMAFDSGRVYKVIGVVKDFPFRSMHQPIEPLLVNPHPHFVDRIVYIKLPAGKFQEKIAAIEKQWRTVFANTGLDYWFLNDEFNRMYVVERRVSSLAKAFAVLAILITILGVFGLASYTAEQRIKEVGIRKVLGAGEKQVVSLFLQMFLKIFGVACILAIPLAWIASYKWLQGFTYRTSISPMVFAISIAGLLVVTLMTIGYEIWKSVRTSPVRSLRTE